MLVGADVGDMVSPAWVGVVVLGAVLGVLDVGRPDGAFDGSLDVGMVVGVVLGGTVGLGVGAPVVGAGLGRAVGSLEAGNPVGSELDGNWVDAAVGPVVAGLAVSTDPMPPPPPSPPFVHLYGQAVPPPTGSTLPSASPPSQPEHGAQKAPLLSFS